MKWRKKTGGHERGSEVFIHGSPLHGTGILKMKDPPVRGHSGRILKQVYKVLLFKSKNFLCVLQPFEFYFFV
jgi:hypothetical protein